MKKIIILIALMFGVGSQASAATLAERVGKWDAGVGVSGVLFVDELQNDTVQLAGNFNYGVMKYVSVGLELSYLFDSRSEGIPGDYDDLGDARAFSTMANVRLYLPLDESQVQPYFVAGIGGIYWDFETSKEVKDDGLTLDLSSALAVQVGGGVDWFVSERMAINIEAAYVFNKPSGSARYEDDVYSGSGESDFVRIGGGLKAII
jgi:opacity protein-like surface antigen